MPKRSATSFCVSSFCPHRPKRMVMIARSRWDSIPTASLSSLRSASASMGRSTTSPSVPSTSLSSSSLPSQSVFSGSSKLTSVRWLLFFRRNIRISFSMQREA